MLTWHSATRNFLTVPKWHVGQNTEALRAKGLQVSPERRGEKTAPCGLTPMLNIKWVHCVIASYQVVPSGTKWYPVVPSGSQVLDNVTPRCPSQLSGFAQTPFEAAPQIFPSHCRIRGIRILLDISLDISLDMFVLMYYLFHIIVLFTSIHRCLYHFYLFLLF